MYTIYGTSTCTYCYQAAAQLSNKGISFTYKEIDKDIDTLNEFRQLFPSIRTVPQILKDNVHIGGYKELQEYIV
jgi:glutaredoxin 3